MSITDELRKWWVRKFPVMDKELHKDFTAIADRIDAEHERAVMSAMNDALYHANEKDMAELGWVRKNKEHVIAHATVEVTPHIDWSRMADELDVFTQLVRGFAEQVEEDA